MYRVLFVCALCLPAILVGCESGTPEPSALSLAGEAIPGDADSIPVLHRSDEEWRRILEPEAYRVLRQQGTERAFTGKWLNNKGKGLYVCRGCGLELFSSDTKFNSGTGWPSYYRAYRSSHIRYVDDRAHGMVRTEVRCARCDGHLGHVFDDGPPPTGRRYCINSVSLDFKSQ